MRRFESAELRQQAWECEKLGSPRPGCCGSLLLGTTLICVGLVGCFRQIWNLSAAGGGAGAPWGTTAMEMPTSAPVSSSAELQTEEKRAADNRANAWPTSAALQRGGSTPTAANSYTSSFSPLAPEEMRHLGVDSTLLAICVALVVIGILPQCLGNGAIASPGSVLSPAPAMPPTTYYNPSSGATWGTSWGTSWWTSWLWWFSSLTSWLPFGRLPWRTPADSLLLPMSPGGSGWLRADGSLHGTGIPGLGSGSGSFGAGPAGGSAWMGPPSAPWGAASATGFSGRYRPIPSETEVSETYQTFGSTLQQMVANLAVIVEQQILAPFLVELEQSDRMWQQVLPRQGFHLTLEPPRLQGSLGGPSGARPQGLSVFDRELPAPLRNDPQAVRLWHNRQVLESYMAHPSFRPCPEQRMHVLGRLQEWRCRGLTRSLQPPRFDGSVRPNPGAQQVEAIPSDAHILENLFVKVLDSHLDFASAFMAFGDGTPVARHLGRVPPAFLRQVMSQASTPKPSPHYEVVTLTKVWKLRAGSENVLEALCMLLLLLRRDAQGSDRNFPASLRSLAGTASAPASSPYGVGQAPSLQGSSPWGAQPWRSEPMPQASVGGMPFGVQNGQPARPSGMGSSATSPSFGMGQASSLSSVGGMQYGAGAAQVPGTSGMAGTAATPSFGFGQGPSSLQGASQWGGAEAWRSPAMDTSSASPMRFSSGRSSGMQVDSVGAPAAPSGSLFGAAGGFGTQVNGGAGGTAGLNGAGMNGAGMNGMNGMNGVNGMSGMTGMNGMSGGGACFPAGGAAGSTGGGLWWR